MRAKDSAPAVERCGRWAGVKQCCGELRSIAHARDVSRSAATVSESLAAMLPSLRERYGVRALWIFGSWARGSATEASDLEVLIDFDGKGMSLFRFVGLEQELSDVLGIKGDLVQRTALRPQIVPAVFREARAVGRCRHRGSFGHGSSPVDGRKDRSDLTGPCRHVVQQLRLRQPEREPTGEKHEGVGSGQQKRVVRLAVWSFHRVQIGQGQAH